MDMRRELGRPVLNTHGDKSRVGMCISSDTRTGGNRKHKKRVVGFPTLLLERRDNSRDRRGVRALSVKHLTLDAGLCTEITLFQSNTIT